MTREQIMQLIPHREPMLLVDEAGVGEDGRAHGHYHVRGDEFFLQGHFPGHPVVPGVMLCEMLAQVSCVLLADRIAGKLTLYTGMRSVRFKNQVKPGDTLQMEIEMLRVREPFYFLKGKGSVNGEICVSSEFSVAVVEPASQA